MTRGILIAGNESSLTGAIAAEAAKRVEQYAAAIIPNRLPDPVKASPAAGKERINLSWNPGSPISARTLILGAENRLAQINEAILICAPPSVRQPAAELSPQEIEILVNDHIKGWFFLVRELSAVFKARNAGTLALVISDLNTAGQKEETIDLMGPSAAASFRAFSQSLLSASFDETYLTLGFSSAETGDEAGFASYIFRILDESSRKNNGKWHKFGRLNLFNR
jgi:hypothetical protein